MVHYNTSFHSRHVLQKSLPPETVKWSLGNACAVCDGSTLFPNAATSRLRLTGGGIESIFLVKFEGCGGHNLSKHEVWTFVALECPESSVSVELD